MILLNSSNKKGICYVETKSLDGETNLKHKQPPRSCINLAKNDKLVMSNFNSAIIECEKENEFIYKFLGSMKLTFRSDPFHLEIDNMLLRGSSLKNTKWAYGIAIYTGHDSKVMMNSMKNKPKFSRIEKATNRYIIMGIFI